MWKFSSTHEIACVICYRISYERMVEFCITTICLHICHCWFASFWPKIWSTLYQPPYSLGLVTSFFFFLFSKCKMVMRSHYWYDIGTIRREITRQLKSLTYQDWRMFRAMETKIGIIALQRTESILKGLKSILNYNK